MDKRVTNTIFNYKLSHDLSLFLLERLQYQFNIYTYFCENYDIYIYIKDSLMNSLMNRSQHILYTNLSLRKTGWHVTEKMQ